MHQNVEDLLAKQEAQALRIAELEATLGSCEESLAAQEKKYEDCPHPKPTEYWSCGCSYDKSSDVCALHAPQLKEARKRIAELEPQLAAQGWTRITPQHQANFGQVVGRWTPKGNFQVMQVRYAWDDDMPLSEGVWTYVRDVNPPSKESK